MLLTKPFIFLTTVVPSILSLRQYDQLYVFGDSLSDFNNLHQLSNYTLPPKGYYSQGRYSNGPTWIEYLSTKLCIHKVKSFAYAGATSDSVQFPATIVQGGVPGALQQIELFSKYYQQNRQPKNPIIAFAFGGNDFPSPGSSPQKMIENLEQSLNTLITKFNLTSFVVMNSTPLDLSPHARSLPKPYQDQFTQIVQGIEYLWSEVIKKYNKQYPKVKIYPFNARDYLKAIIDNTVKEHNYKNMEFNKPCFIKVLDSNGQIAKNSTICKQPNRYIFWDNLHPTTKVHKYVADKVYSVITKRN